MTAHRLFSRIFARLLTTGPSRHRGTHTLDPSTTLVIFTVGR